MEAVQNLPEEINQSANRQVLFYLRGRSCHSDIALPFTHSARAVGLDIYCSYPKNFGYLVAHRQGGIVAFAQGMQGVSFRLTPQTQLALLSRGAQEIPELPGWLQIPLFGSERFERDLDTFMQEAGNVATT